MNQNSRVYIAGHEGLVGSSLKHLLENSGFQNLVFRTHSELDLRRQQPTEVFFEKTQPEYVFLCAARVGGIKENIERKAELLYDNLQIQTNVIHSAWKYGSKKLLFMGSNCMYPKDSPQPIREESFLSGRPETTNDAFAVAKMAGVKMCQDYRGQYGADFSSIVPCSLYGPNDNFDPESSHFVPGFIRRMHEAKINGKENLEVWGTGNPRRELLHVDDLASAAVFLMGRPNLRDIINIGSGEDYEIREIAEIIKRVVGFERDLTFNPEKPDGIMRKLLDSRRIRSLGCTPKIGLEEGLEETYRWFMDNVKI
jgi:GDP-L-fucose synthase